MTPSRQELENEYYSVPRVFRFFENPYMIGGRDTDLEQLGASILNRLREIYPINQVPNHLNIQAEELNLQLSEIERKLWSLLVNVSKDQQERNENDGRLAEGPGGG